MVMIFLLLSNLSAYNPTWPELVAEKNWIFSHSTETEVGIISVYKKMVDNFPCFRGETETKQEPQLLIEIAGDAEAALKWSSADVTEAKELARTAKYVDYYQYLNIPILSDRYWFLRGYFETKKGEKETQYIFRWERLDKGGEHSEYYQQIQEKYPSAEETPINIGAWVISPTAENNLVQYYICTHPGGSVPPMLQTVGTEQTLPNNLKDILIEAKRRTDEK